MKPHLVLMSHGEMAAATLASAKMIVGDLAQAEVITMAAEDGLAGTQAKLTNVLQASKAAPTLIIVDLKGGTPCNAAVLALGSYPNLRVVTGLNLAMVIEACVASTESVDELTAYLQTIGQQAVITIEESNMSTDEEEIEE